MTTVVKNAGWLLSSLSASANVRSIGDGVVVPGNPWFTYHQCDGWELAKGLHDSWAEGPVWPPVPDWSIIADDVRVYEFLNAIDAFPNWYPTSGDRSVLGYAQRPASEWSGGNEYFRCIIADWMIPYVSGRALGPDLSLLKYLPAIWPGNEYVSLGAPINVNTPYHYAGSCNGILVDINTMPDSMSRYDWGEITQIPRAGYVSFQTDSGYCEDPQPISYPQHIICPKLSRLAGGFYLRPHAGGELTVTPWTYYTP